MRAYYHSFRFIAVSYSKKALVQKSEYQITSVKHHNNFMAQGMKGDFGFNFNFYTVS